MHYINYYIKEVSLDLMTKDTYQVIKFVLKELKQEKLYLLGSLWGNVLGFDIVQNILNYFTHILQSILL